jgi:hypothetical protein
MAKERSSEKSSEEEGMTEGQRLTMLEKTTSMNRIFLILLALLITISLSVTITMAIITAVGDDEVPAAITAELDSLRQQVELLKQDNKTLGTQLALLVDEMPRLRTALNNGSAPMFQRLLIAQEESNQEFLRGVKEGMYDLARMVPGSRTWLELYNEKMDRALQFSQNRQRDLTRLKTGEPLIEP